jgi:hypothetical protein
MTHLKTHQITKKKYNFSSRILSYVYDIQNMWFFDDCEIFLQAMRTYALFLTLYGLNILGYNVYYLIYADAFLFSL